MAWITNKWKFIIQMFLLLDVPYSDPNCIELSSIKIVRFYVSCQWLAIWINFAGMPMRGMCTNLTSEKRCHISKNIKRFRKRGRPKYLCGLKHLCDVIYIRLTSQQIYQPVASQKISESFFKRGLHKFSYDLTVKHVYISTRQSLKKVRICWKIEAIKKRGLMS